MQHRTRALNRTVGSFKCFIGPACQDFRVEQVGDPGIGSEDSDCRELMPLLRMARDMTERYIPKSKIRRAAP